MPVITVQGRPLPSERKRGFVQKLTDLVSETYEMAPSDIIVFIGEYPTENIGVAGQLVADRRPGPPPA